jgi:hypothetical protein
MNVGGISIPPSASDLTALIRLAEVLGADQATQKYLVEVKEAAAEARVAQEKSATDSKAAIALRAQVEQEIKTMRTQHEEELAKERVEHDAKLKAANDDLEMRSNKLEQGLKALADMNEEQRRRNVAIEQHLAHVNEALSS